MSSCGGGTPSAINPNRDVEVMADCGGSPNGAAVGPDGYIYICNSGGMDPATYLGGETQRVELDSGKMDTLYEACDNHAPAGPNDLVFHRTGSF